MKKFAQSNHTAVAAAAESGIPFDTYGNLWGRPITADRTGQTHPYQYGYIAGAAAAQLKQDAEKGIITYALWSWGTVIAWKTTEGWRYDAFRHSASTDNALSSVRAAITGDVLILRTRHHLSDSQIAMLDGLSLYPGFPSGQGYRTADVLERQGLITREGQMGIRTITDKGRAYLTGTGIKAVWA